MPTTAFLNGRFFTLDGGDAAPAAVSAFDAGFQHAVGLFETMLGGMRDAGGAWCMRIDEHLARLVDSARELGLSDSLRAGALAEAVMETIRRAGFDRARVRLTVTGGDLNLAARGGAAASGGSGGGDPTVLIVAQRATEYPAGMFERGVAATIADARANPLNPLEGHKTLNYWWRLRELQRAGSQGAAEAIVLSVTNHLCGGCVSNILLVKDGTLLTPIARGEEGRGSGPGAEAPSMMEDPDSPPVPVREAMGGFLPSPVLPGVVRAWVRDWAAANLVIVRRQMLSVADLLEADEVLLTNSSWGVLPVVKVEANAIGDAVPGPVGKSVCAAWRALVEEYASGGAG